MPCTDCAYVITRQLVLALTGHYDFTCASVEIAHRNGSANRALGNECGIAWTRFIRRA